MKSLQEFKTVVEEEKQDFTKFDALVRAGLANKAQLQRLHQILGKMSEEKPNFSPADRAIIQNMFTKMVDMITNNPQMYRTARKAVSEGVHDTADFKLDVTGRKVKAHRVKVGDALDTLQADNVKEEIEVIVEDLHNEPPFILLLKRTAVRMYPNNVRVAIYRNEKLNKEFGEAPDLSINELIYRFAFSFKEEKISSIRIPRKCVSVINKVIQNN